MINLSDTYQRFEAPKTKREVVKLTEGNAYCYPLYYFIPSITKDEKHLIYHRAEKGEVQLYRLNLESGESRQLTYASCSNTHWRPWGTDQGKGVLDHRSVLNRERNEVIYLDGNEVHQVKLETMEDEILFKIDNDRIAIGQNCVTPDGKWFIYIHHDREVYEKMFENDYWNSRHLSRGTVLCAYNLDTGEKRNLVVINSPIHHVLPFDNKHVVFCHPTTENGMLLTDIEGGWYKHMRTQDIYGGTVCHYVATSRGLAYEVLGSSKGVMSGLYNPFTDNNFEFKLPEEFGYTHTGCDPEGKIWFYENENRETDIHDMYFLQKYYEEKKNEWIKLIGNWPTYGGGQKSHFHPRLTQDRKWIIFTAGDKKTETNDIYLLNVEDLTTTQGIPEL